MPILSVIIPVFNEAKTIKQILEKVEAVNIDKEIIVVDNGSTDGTDRILRGISFGNIKVIHHTSNRGKGGGILTGFLHANGEIVIIQDADLEYDPNDYHKLMELITNDKADLVLGARFLEGHQGLFMHRLGNRFLTGLLNFLFKTKINDYATCYKLAKSSTWAALGLKATGFDIDVEIVSSALKKKMRVAQAPVFYMPRTYKEGKKIRWVDGIWAIFYMFKYRFGS